MPDDKALEEFLQEALKDYPDGSIDVDVSGEEVSVWGAEAFRRIADKAGIKEIKMDGIGPYFVLDIQGRPGRYSVHLKSERREFLKSVNSPENMGKYVIV